MDLAADVTWEGNILISDNGMLCINPVVTWGRRRASSIEYNATKVL
jgi:hypothetical protein